MPGVTAQHPLYIEHAPQWERVRDCAAGSDAVKARRTKYLPMLDSHHTRPEKYLEYLGRALFYNATGRTIQGLAGSIFQKAPGVEAGAAFEDTLDITLTGEPIEQFALKTTKEYLTTGRYGILVDMASEEAVRPRPYWCGYRAEDIINWRFERMGGDQELCFVVLREVIDDPEPEDEFSANQILQYRVLRLSKDGVYTQQLYTAPKAPSIPGVTRQQEFIPGEVVTPLRRGVPLDFIPFSLPWGMIEPPLVDLADVNLAYFRGSAQLKHGLHYVALPTPWVSGAIGGETGKPLAIGSGTAWQLELNGKAGMLEFTGQGLGAIRQDLMDMQFQMTTLGARLLESAPKYAETATSVSMRFAADHATLRNLAQVVEQQLSWALQVHEWWLGSEELVSNVSASVALNKVFYDQTITADELRALLLALQSSSISYDTFYARLSNTGWMREGVDADEEKEAIKEDGDQFKKLTPAASGVPGEKLGEGEEPPSTNSKPKPKVTKPEEADDQEE